MIAYPRRRNAGEQPIRVVVLMPKSEIEAIDGWGLPAGMESRSAAIRALIKAGLAAEKSREDDDGAVIGTRTPSSSANPADVGAPASSHHG